MVRLPACKIIDRMYASFGANESKTRNDNFFAADQLFLWWVA